MKQILIFLLPALLVISSVSAQNFPQKPNPPRLVNDFAGMLESNQVTKLENKLVSYNNNSSTQIAVVTINSLEGYEIGDYSFQLAEKWGIGQKGKDNGLLVLISLNDHKMFIATGYGLEGVIPDATAKGIIEDYMKPNFRASNYYKGIDEATSILMGLAKGEYKADQFVNKRSRRGKGFFPLLFIIFFFIVTYFRYRGARKSHIGSGNLSFWAFLMLMNSSRRSGYGHFSSGSGSFGGGFGGFGGGSFGGGGAGGSW